MKRLFAIGSVMFVLIFVFALALSVSSEVQATNNPCCYMRPTEDCGSGWGEVYNGYCSCTSFHYPSCQHICRICW